MDKDKLIKDRLEIEEEDYKMATKTILDLHLKSNLAYLKIEEKIALFLSKFNIKDNEPLNIYKNILEKDRKKIREVVLDFLEKNVVPRGIKGILLKRLRLLKNKAQYLDLEIFIILVELSIEKSEETRKLLEETYKHNYSAIEIMAAKKYLDISKIFEKSKIDNKNYYDRIWENTMKVKDNLRKELETYIFVGNVEKINEILEKFKKIDKRNIEKAIYYESKISAELGAYATATFNGKTNYEIVAILDSRTSEICRLKDGKVYPIEHYEVGITAPPFHVNCRSTVIYY